MSEHIEFYKKWFVRFKNGTCTQEQIGKLTTLGKLSQDEKDSIILGEDLYPNGIVEQIPTYSEKIKMIDDEISKINTGQSEQDFIIDDIIFEVIPTLESQINTNTSQPVMVASVFSNALIKKGREGMAAYLAKKIIEGRDYTAVFKTISYRQYQDEVDVILELEGYGHLINRK